MADAVVAAALGALQTLAYVHTALPGAWLLPLATLAWLVWRLDTVPPCRAALLAACYATAWLVAGVWWLFISMHRYGGLPAWMAATAVLLLAAALSGWLALAAAAYARWRRGGAGDAWLFAALWLLAELARGVVFTGFPWLASGYSQLDAPLAALAPWVGVYGIGAVLAFAAAALARLIRSRGRRWGPAAAALALVAWVGFALAVVVSLLLAPWRIALASGSAFILAQILDISLFNRLRRLSWWKAPLLGSLAASVLDTAVFFFLAFAGTDLDWTLLAAGDLAVKAAMAALLLAPYRLMLPRLQVWATPS